MPNTQIFRFEGPCARVRIDAMVLVEGAELRPIVDGVFATTYWRQTAEEVPCEVGPTYIVTIERVEAA